MGFFLVSYVFGENLKNPVINQLFLILPNSLMLKKRLDFFLPCKTIGNIKIFLTFVRFLRCSRLTKGIKLRRKKPMDFPTQLKNNAIFSKILTSPWKKVLQFFTWLVVCGSRLFHLVILKYLCRYRNDILNTQSMTFKVINI